MTQDVYLEQHPALSEDALEQLRVLVELFGFIRDDGREFLAMLTPVGVDGVGAGAAIAYEGNHLNRARQTLIASVHVRQLWHPEEVLWACDSLTREYSGEVPEEIVPPSQDPRATEALSLGHCRTSWGPGVRHASLPYGWSDSGELEFRSDRRTWSEGRGDPMTHAVACAVSPNLPPEVTEQVLALGDPQELGIFVVAGGLN